MAHALTTESEEIMGLLLGDVVDVGGQGCCEERLKARIWSVSLHRREQAVRSDDRVEISPEQLAAASGEAERMTAELGIQTRVVGWSEPVLSCRSLDRTPALLTCWRVYLPAGITRTRTWR
jgi:BRCA1/BRCA2-containing complex subunit 3